MPSVPLLPNPHGRPPVLRHYVQSSPHLFDRSSIAKQNLSHRANVICDGSPSRIRMVRRISLGMTTRPRSSIRRTIPVAFIYEIPPVKANFTSVVSAPREMNMHEVPLTIFCRQSTAHRIAAIKRPPVVRPEVLHIFAFLQSAYFTARPAYPPAAYLPAACAPASERRRPP